MRPEEPVLPTWPGRSCFERTFPAAAYYIWRMGMSSLAKRDRTQPAPEEPLSGNLSDWMEQKTLGSLVLSVTCSIDEQDLHPVAPLTAGIAFRPRWLLALVTYCYAMAI